MSVGLVGKFVFHSGPEHWQCGEIIEEVSAGHFLVKMDNNVPEAVTALVLVHLCDLVTDFDDEATLGVCFWNFYNTRAELQAYLDWLNTPETKPSVVKLVKK